MSSTSEAVAAPASTASAQHQDPSPQSPLAAKATSITKFKVFARVRPFIESELADNRGEDGLLRSIVEMIDRKTVLLDPKEDYAPKAQFEFDESLWSIPKDYKLKKTFADTGKKPFASQADVYKAIASGVADAAFEGINSAILSYGQTGSGKTYTMMGNYDPYTVSSSDDDGEQGIIPRLCHDVFRMVDEKRKAQEPKKEKERLVYVVEVTFVEVYMEAVRDLLDPVLAKRAMAAQRDGGPDAKVQPVKEARIRNDPESGPYVEDVTKYRVENWAHCCALLERGSAQRRTCANNVHVQSSRSHAIFTLTVLEQQTLPPKDKYSPPTVKTRTGRINLVDLAGSERGGFTEYVKESAQINKSLLSLRRVIDNLVDRQNLMMEHMKLELEREELIKSGAPRPLTPPPPNLPQVPFRDSVLTWLLSDSIGGNARTTMIAALSPHQKNYGDTLATLQWSSKARGLVSVVKANDVSTTVQQGYNVKLDELDKTLHSYRQNVDSIKNELALKNQMTDELDGKIVQVMKQTIAAKEEHEAKRTLSAALALQRAYRHWRHRIRVAHLQERLDAERAGIQDNEAQLGELMPQLAAAVAASAASQAAAAAKKAEVEGKAERLAAFDNEEAEFAVRYEQWKRIHDEGALVIEELTAKQNGEREESSAKHAESKERRDKVVGERDRVSVELQEMQERVDSAGTEEERAKRMEDVKTIVAANASMDSGRLTDLRKRKAELAARKKELEEKLKDLRAKAKK